MVLGRWGLFEVVAPQSIHTSCLWWVRRKHAIDQAFEHNMKKESRRAGAQNIDPRDEICRPLWVQRMLLHSLWKAGPVGLDCVICADRKARADTSTNEVSEISDSLRGRVALPPGCVLSRMPIAMILAHTRGQINIEADMGAVRSTVEQSLVRGTAFFVCDTKQKWRKSGPESACPRDRSIVFGEGRKVHQHPVSKDETKCAIPAKFDVPGI